MQLSTQLNKVNKQKVSHTIHTGNLRHASHARLQDMQVGCTKIVNKGLHHI